MTPTDWPAVEEIYAQGIADGEATFEVSTPSWESFDAGEGRGTASGRCRRRGSRCGLGRRIPGLESICIPGCHRTLCYVARTERGQGIGRLLVEAFIAAADKAGFWTIQSSVFPENSASLRLHEAAGFRVIGHRERIARSGVGPHAGQWRDTVLIERRSVVNGVDERQSPMKRRNPP